MAQITLDAATIKAAGKKCKPGDQVTIEGTVKAVDKDGNATVDVDADGIHGYDQEDDPGVMAVLKRKK